jgi:hypothetical protein
MSRVLKRPVQIQAHTLSDQANLGRKAKEGVIFPAQKMVVTLDGVIFPRLGIGVEKRPNSPKKLGCHEPGGEAIEPWDVQYGRGFKEKRHIRPDSQSAPVKHPSRVMGFLGRVDEVVRFPIILGINQGFKIPITGDGFALDGIVHSSAQQTEKPKAYLGINGLECRERGGVARGPREKKARHRQGKDKERDGPMVEFHGPIKIEKPPGRQGSWLFF